jgi:uncharacterized protein YxjI
VRLLVDHRYLVHRYIVAHAARMRAFRRAWQARRMTSPATGWYPDPSGQFEQRYWDGSAWTEHVVSQGQQTTAPLGAAPVQVSTPEKVVRQVQQQAGLGVPAASGSGSLLDEPVLVVNQKAKLIELTNEYAVYDQQGQQLGSVVQVGQGAMRKAVRMLTSYDQYLTHKLEVRDQRGAVVLHLLRPAKLLKSRVVVSLPDGQEVGTLRQENAIGKIRFAIEAGGERIGSINAENWRAWNFSIKDHTETEVARITKTWEGLAKTMFTTADNYVVQIHRRLEDPLRMLVVASALTVDTALKQDKRGMG